MINLHGPVRVPATVGEGTAEVVVSFEDWKGGKVKSSLHRVPVVGKALPKLEPVSPRLKSYLIHPSKKATLVGISYTLDGKRIIAGDFPGGVLQVWDAITGEQAARIETGSERISQWYFTLSRDGKTVFSWRKVYKTSPIERDGKKLTFVEFDGETRAWDVGSGKLVKTFKADPPRGVDYVVLSPDGSTLFTAETPSGVNEDGRSTVLCLWDVKTGKCRTLADGLYGIQGVFTPCGKRIVVPLGGKSRYVSQALKVFDVATLKEVLSIPVPRPHTQMAPMAVTPDGARLIGVALTAPGADQVHTRQCHVKFWDSSTGKETASFAAANNSILLCRVFSPDGKLLAGVSALDKQSKLVLFDVASEKLAKTIILGGKAETTEPVFSPDGKWLAVATQVVPNHLLRADPESEGIEQARIHLVEVASGEVRETLVAPPGFVKSLCFSPDGRTLASGGNGRVLLWDVANLTGGVATRK